jgi:arylsulfatase
VHQNERRRCDREAGSGKIEQTTPFKYPLSENQDIGRDTGTAVVEDSRVPFVFEGKIEHVVVELAP